ncbi:MAG: (2Fe-2S)-binding protein [Peptoniphilaceae bacterium]
MYSPEHGPYEPRKEEVLHFKPQYKLLKCKINGEYISKVIDVRASLTDMLRNDFRLTSVKKGCEVGECGACAVLIDGKSFNSCIYLAIWAENKDIWTLEGLINKDGSLSEIQEAFLENQQFNVDSVPLDLLFLQLKSLIKIKNSQETS